MRKPLLGLVFLLLFTGSHLSAQPKTEDALFLQTSEMAHLMVNYNADKGSISRFYSTSSAEWGGRDAGSFSIPERIHRLLRLVDDYQQKLSGLNFARLSKNGQVDFILFNQRLKEDAYLLLEEQKKQQALQSYLPFAERMIALERPRRRGLKVEAQQVAQEMDAIRKLVLSAQEDWKQKPKLHKDLVVYGQLEIRSLQSLLKKYFDFYNEYDPQFHWWVPATYKRLDSVLGKSANAFAQLTLPGTGNKDDGSGIVGNPIGKTELERQLKQAFIPYTPEELVAIANKEFAWCDAEMLKASQQLGFGNNWKAALEKVKNTYVPPGMQPQTMNELYDEVIAFLKKHELLTIPPLAEETWRMYMMSAERQLVSPFFLGGESLIISYPTSTMDYDDKLMSLRGNNPHFSRAVLHHEIIAGHHLQGYMNNRYKVYRNFNNPFWTEGNALYWEMVLWDLNYPRTAEDRIGMLFWRMHRCARIIFSLNYHLGNWTPQQCIDFLVDRVGHERANAEGEVRRSFTGGYGPLYQLAYMVGGLQFYALKKELVDTKKMTYKQFHDAILHENAMPVELLRVLFTEQTVKRDFETNWRFYKF
jgi:hypothetical protein